MAFKLKQEGAATVIATDRGNREPFRFLRDQLRLDVPYLPGSTLDNSDIHCKLEGASLPLKYDLVVLSAVIYHAYDPLVAMLHARRLLKTDGLIIVETVFRPGDNAALYLNTEVEDPVREPNTYFLPTPRGLGGMLRFTACNRLATIVNVDRLAVLARACRPSEITDGTEALGVCIREGAHYGALSFDELEEDEAESAIEYAGRRGTWSLNRRDFSTRFKLQPTTV